MHYTFLFQTKNQPHVLYMCRYYKDDIERVKLGQPMPEKWKLFFKFFCYLKPQNVPSDSIESVFLYEQVQQ